MENTTEAIKNEKPNLDQAFYERIDRIVAEILAPKPGIVPDMVNVPNGSTNSELNTVDT